MKTRRIRDVAMRVLLGLLLGILGAACRGGGPVCEGCNVVLITIDTLRADHLGLYGHVRDTSPHIDALGAESVVFDQAVVAWPKTTPGLGSIMTGNYPQTIRMMYGTFDPMREDSTLISEILQTRGYATAGFTTNGNLSIERGWNQGFDEYEELWRESGEPRQVSERGLRFLDEQGAGPFFLWLHYIDPHSPYRAGEKAFRGTFQDDEHADRLLYDAQRKVEIPLEEKSVTWRQHGINAIPKSSALGRETDVRRYVAEYDAEIRYTDHYVGQVLDRLKAEPERWAKTVVVLVADHGEALGDHDWYFDHGRFAYDDVTRVPFLIRAPGIEPRRISHPVSSNDVAPTILGLLGIETEEAMEGQSLLPVIRGERDRVSEYVFSSAGYNREHQTSVRDGRWKLIYVPAPEAQDAMQGVPFELYDLETDPRETRNRVEQEPEVFERLKGVLFTWMKEELPPLVGYETWDGFSRIYAADYEYPTIAVEGKRFYVKVPPAHGHDVAYCFGLPVPDPDALVTLQLVEANSKERPYERGDAKWDDPALDRSCLGDAWGCLSVDGKKLDELPFSIRLGDLGPGVDPTAVSLQGLGNDKTFCFRGGSPNKRTEATELGWIVEILGVVESANDPAADLDEVTRENLRELGYIE